METRELIEIQSMFKDLSIKIDKLAELKTSNEEPNTSVDVNLIAEALAQAQEEMRVANLNKTNSYLHTGYADLVSVVNASRPYLSKYGLSVTQQIISKDDGGTTLISTLWHTSGQHIKSRIRLTPPNNDIKTVMSYIAAMKRLSYSSLVGVVDMGEDDDGEMADSPKRTEFVKGTSLNHDYKPAKESAEVISKDNLDELNYELQGHKDICEDILNRLNLMALADMPKSKYHYAIRKIREIKLIRAGNLVPSNIQEV